MLSCFTKVKSAKAEATGKLFTFVTQGSEDTNPTPMPSSNTFVNYAIRMVPPVL